MAKYLRYKKDGYIVAFNEQLVGNTDYEEIEVAKGEAVPHLPQFMAMEPDEEFVSVAAGRRKRKSEPEATGE